MILTDRLATACPYGYGSIRLWGSVAYTIGAQVSGMIYEMLFPLAHYFVFALSLLAMLFCLYQMRDQKTSLPKKDKIQTKTIFKHLFTNKAFLYFVLIYCLYQGIYFPLYMQENGASTALVGTAPLLFSLADIPVYLITDRLLARFHYRSSLIFACHVATFRFGWYALLPDPQWILYGFFLQSISNTFILIASVKVILYLVDDKYLNTAYGMLAMLAKGIFPLFVQIGCGYLLEWIPGIQGYVITYYLYAGATLLCLLLCFGISRGRKKTGSYQK